MSSISKEPELVELRQRRLAYFNHSSTLDSDVCEKEASNWVDKENNKKTLHQTDNMSVALSSKNKNSKNGPLDTEKYSKFGTEMEFKSKPCNSDLLDDKTAKDVVNSKLYAQRLSEKPVETRVDNPRDLHLAERPQCSINLQSSIDVNDLGLSTHRPEINTGPHLVSEPVLSDDTTLYNKHSSNALAERTVLEDTIADVQLRELLGEEKYQEFVEKSRKDIEALKLEREASTGRLSNFYAESFIESTVQPSPSMTTASNVLPSREHCGRPKLNRPKDAPALVTNTLVKSRHDLDSEVPQMEQMYRTKNYEQTNVSRNVTYLSNEIYQQAFQEVLYNDNTFRYVNGPWQASPQIISPRHFSHMTPRSELMYGYHQHVNRPDLMYHGQPFMMYNSSTPPGSPVVHFSPHPPIYQASNHPVNYMQGLHPSTMVYPALQSPGSNIGGPMFIPYPHPPRGSPQQQSTTTKYPSSLSARQDKQTNKPQSKLSKDQASDREDAIPHPPTEEKLSMRRPHREHIEGVRQFHESRRRAVKESPELEPAEQFAVDRLEKYFSSVEDYFQSLDGTDVGEFNSRGGFGLVQSRESNMDAELETLVASTITNLKAGGVTERLRDLGIEIPFLKVPLNAENMNPIMDLAQDDSKQPTSSKPKEAKICTECCAMNKSYMSWCASCGEILIGVEVTVLGSEISEIPVPSKSDLHVQTPEPRSGLISDPTTHPSDILVELNSEPQTQSYKEGEDSGFDDKVSPSKPKSQLEAGETRHKHSRKLSSRSFRTDMAETKDSGRAPSNGEEREIIQKKGKTEIEIIDICESIGDPVIRGFLKSYLRKRSFGVDFSTKHKKSSLLGKKKTKKANPVQPQNIEDLKTESFNPSQHQVHNDSWSNSDCIVSEVSESVSCNGHTIPLLDLGFSSDDDDKRKNLDISLTDDEDDDGSVDYEAGQGDAALQQSIDEPSIQLKPYSPNMTKSQMVTDKSTTHSSATRKPTASSSNLHRKLFRESSDSPVVVSDRAAIPQRHWMRSSIAWSTYNPGELNRDRSAPNSKNHSRKKVSLPPRCSEQIEEGHDVDFQLSQGRQRPASAKIQRSKVLMDARPGSAGIRKRTKWEGQRDINLKSRTQNMRRIFGDVKTSPENSVVHLRETSQSCDVENINILDSAAPLPTANKTLSSPVKTFPSGPSGSQMALSAYSMYHTMTPRISDGSFSVWLCLPDELLLFILSHLSLADLSRCAQVCKHFYRVTMDQSLWRSIKLTVRHHLTDDTLEVIGQRQPISLSLIQCHGSNVTTDGLHRLFQQCGRYLEELNISRCSRGALIGDNVLQQASLHCEHLTHLDISWTHVTNTGLSAISSKANRLESVSLNGCQSVSNQGLENLLRKHGKSLRVLEVFGCFNINQAGIRGIGQHCHNLITLNLGQCYKVTDSSVMEVTSSLSRLQSLDLRGCKQVRDNSVRRIVKNCPRLTSIALANCPHISDVAVSEIATYLTGTRWIDLCGCKNITDESLRALTKNCSNLTYIDIGSTGCTKKSVSALANQCSDRLEVVKLNFLSDIDETSVLKLVKNCSRLKALQLYGCKGLQSMAAKLKRDKPMLSVEM